MADERKTPWTQGEWFSDTAGDCRARPRIYSGTPENPGKLIAEVGNAEEWASAADEWEANARLVAAAPELCEALAALVDLWVGHADGGSYSEIIREKAIPALAKARGER